MARGIYRGVDGVARKVKKEYRGVDGVARRIKKEYRGVDGVARLCYSSSNYQFMPFTNGASYGEAITSKDGNSLYLRVSGTAPSGVAIDAGYNLADANGVVYTIPAGSTIAVTMRQEVYPSNHLACMRLTDSHGNYSYPVKNTDVTDHTYTVTKDSTLMFLAECGFGYSTSANVQLWVDKFEINGESII